ncbi:MAG: hypothetical protein ABJD11_05125 [Gemmatimonadota bacterium]
MMLASAGTLLGGVGLMLAADRRRWPWALAIKRRLLPVIELDEKAATGLLAPHEMSAIIGLAAVLIPSDQPFDPDFFTRFVNRRTASAPGCLVAYRDAARLLLELGRKYQSPTVPFGDLPLHERSGILESLLTPYAANNRLMKSTEPLFTSESKQRLRKLVVHDLLDAWYRSAGGWAVVGYTHFPGVPASDPLEYSKPRPA